MTDERGHLRLPTPEVREQLHHMPVGYTAAAGADERARLRLVGNGWHWGVASRLLSLLVVAASIGSVSAAPSKWFELEEPRVALLTPTVRLANLREVSGRPLLRRESNAVSGHGSGSLKFLLDFFICSRRSGGKSGFH